MELWAARLILQGWNFMVSTFCHHGGLEMGSSAQFLPLVLIKVSLSLSLSFCGLPALCMSFVWRQKQEERLSVVFLGCLGTVSGPMLEEVVGSTSFRLTLFYEVRLGPEPGLA